MIAPLDGITRRAAKLCKVYRCAICAHVASGRQRANPPRSDMSARMIDIQVLCRKDPAALARLIAGTMRGGIVVEREAEEAHLAVLLAADDLDQVTATYRPHQVAQALDPENDWSTL
jgi:hypothetical protein